MTLKTLAIVAALMFIAVPVFAQESGAAAAGTLLAVPFAMAIASSLCGLAQGKAIAAAVEGMARNPGAAGPIRITLILGLAFIESLALFTLIKT
ncbi:MAG: ATP synthase F0 subunit C [Bryobacteraceae bacterium]|nr:ATP synthase F0 subunit C [Bryobacteraceae bacterium]